MCIACKQRCLRSLFFLWRPWLHNVQEAVNDIGRRRAPEAKTRVSAVSLSTQIFMNLRLAFLECYGPRLPIVSHGPRSAPAGRFCAPPDRSCRSGPERPDRVPRVSKNGDRLRDAGVSRRFAATIFEIVPGGVSKGAFPLQSHNAEAGDMVRVVVTSMYPRTSVARLTLSETAIIRVGRRPTGARGEEPMIATLPPHALW